MSSIDFYPTMLEMAGLGEPGEGERDGVSLVPLLRQNGDLGREAIYWHYPHYHGSGAMPSGAIRMGRYKLVEFFEDGDVELYDLEEDLSEAKDVSEERSERAEALQRRLERWRSSVKAQLPVPNPDYDQQ